MEIPDYISAPARREFYSFGKKTQFTEIGKLCQNLRQMMVFLNMFPVNQPEVMISNASQRFDKEGELTDDTTKKLIRQLLEKLVEWTNQLTGRMA